MKILLFGKNGQVGWELNRSLLPLGEVVALGREDADLSNPEGLREIVQTIKPDVIVNAAAYTAVDKAEEEEELASVINGVAPGILAQEAKKINALLVHYSTDYVFDGTKETPYLEVDKPNPINAYGRTKLSGEVTVQSSGCDYFIFRTSWVYSSRGHNFLLTILKLAKERNELNVVADQIGAPTSARLIAETTALCLHQAIKEKRTGIFSPAIYNLAATNNTTWYGFSEAIIDVARSALDLQLKVKNIKAVPTADHSTLANRPMNSQLSLDKLERAFNVKMPNWRWALALCLDDIIKK